jgi:hypothetical protein
MLSKHLFSKYLGIKFSSLCYLLRKNNFQNLDK